MHLEYSQMLGLVHRLRWYDLRSLWRENTVPLTPTILFVSPENGEYIVTALRMKTVIRAYEFTIYRQ